MTQPQPEVWEQQYAAQLEEYSQYVAAGPIYVGNALAYNEGDPIPASNVKALGYEKHGLAVRRGSKAPSSSSPGTK